MFSMDSSFWRYKVHADIRGGSPIFLMKLFRQIYVYLRSYAVLIICPKY